MADDKIVRIKLDGSGARLEAGRTNAAVKGVGTSADGATRSMFSLSKAAAGVITALATSKIIQYADAWTNVNNRLKAATQNTRELAIAQDGILAIAQEAGVELGSVADAYSRISQATSELGVSQERVLDVTRKVTLALKAGGATGAETASVMMQLGQALGSGALQGDELRSILEASIPVSKALAKEFNTNVGSLKNLGAEGKLTSDRVVAAIENMDEKALTFTKDISSGFTTVNNALTVYVGKMDESLGISGALGGALFDLSNNIQTVIDIAGALVLIVGAKYVGAAATAISSNLTLAASSLKASTTMNAMGTVVARTTVLMNAQALAARSAGAAMAFLGGPLGVALIAAGSLIYFAETAETAGERSKRLAGEVDDLTASFKGLTNLQRQIQLTNINNEFNETQLKLIEANKKLEQFKGFAESPVKTEGIRTYQNEVDRLNAKLDKLSVKQQAIFASGLPDGGEFTNPVENEGNANRGLDKFFAQDGIFSSGSDNANNSDFEAQINKEKLITQAMQEEIEARRAFQNGEINQRQLDEELALQNVYYNYEARRQAILENEQITADQRNELLAVLREQEILAEQEKLAAINSATSNSLEERAAMQEAYNQSIQALQMQTYSNATALLNALNGESKAAALVGIGIQTATAFIANKAATASAATLAYASQLIPGDPTSPIRAAAAAAKATSLGGINGALILAAGAAKGAGALGGGGGGSASSGGGSGSSSFTPSAASTASTQTNNTRRIISFEGLDNLGDNDNVPITKKALYELFSSDENAIVAINNGQKQGVRVGAINNG